MVEAIELRISGSDSHTNRDVGSSDVVDARNEHPVIYGRMWYGILSRRWRIFSGGHHSNSSMTLIDLGKGFGDDLSILVVRDF